MKKDGRQPLLIGICLLTVLATGCGRKEKQAEEAPPPPMVVGPEDAAVVMRGEIETGPALSGTLTAKDQATIRSQLAASVLETFADPGDRVVRGTLLARLDGSALRQALDSSRSAVTSARNSLAVAEREEERQRVLAAAGAVAERNVETAQQSVVAARANLSQAQAQLAAAEEQLAHTSVRSPLDGVISEKPVSAGDVVQPGSALYTVVDPTRLELEATIPAEQLAEVRSGSPVRFTVVGSPGRVFTGQITRVNPVADAATRQVRVYAELPNVGMELVGGLYAQGRVGTNSAQGLIVPTAAIDRRMAKPAVVRVRDGKVERVEVQLGLADEETQRVEVRQGVKEGDVVLLGAAQEITPGTPIQLEPAVRQAAERIARAL